jgi:hypothetical protein
LSAPVSGRGQATPSPAGGWLRAALPHCTKPTRWAWPGTRSSRGTRRWLVPLAAAASIIALTAVIVSVASARTADHRNTHPAPLAARRGQGRLVRKALDYYFPATGAQYTEGLAFEWTHRTILDRLIKPCLSRAGFSEPPFSWPERQYLLSFPDNSQFPDLAQRARTREMTPFGNGLRGQKAGRVSRAYDAAMQRCTARFAGPITRLDAAAGRLDGPWLSLVTRIQSSRQVSGLQPAFGRCLKARGVPAVYAQSATAAANDLFGEFFGWMDHLGITDTSTRQRIAQQHRWTPVFVHCARHAVTTMQGLQLAQRARFFQHHARQVLAIETLVRNLSPVRS